MATPEFPLLEPAEEDALHLSRLLSVDERPFSRITKRLLAKDAFIRKFPTQLATPPPDEAEDEAAASDQSQADAEKERRLYHDDLLLDFAGLESTLIRIQFLKRANERERERYAAEKSKILATADAVRLNTAELRVQLVEAQKSLALKKEYDEQAELIFKDKALKSRDALASENEKLRAEIEDLEQEGRDFGGLWRERSVRFDRVVAEGRSLTRYIKGEKEEDEDEQDGDADEAAEGHSSERKGDSSAVGTPRPDAGGITPLHPGIESDDQVHAAQQELTQRALGSSLRVPAADANRSNSPAPPSVVGSDLPDTDMNEAGDPVQIGSGSVAGDEGSIDPSPDTMDTS